VLEQQMRDLRDREDEHEVVEQLQGRHALLVTVSDALIAAHEDSIVTSRGGGVIGGALRRAA
jgi:hypothetical protein